MINSYVSLFKLGFEIFLKFAAWIIKKKILLSFSLAAEVGGGRGGEEEGK